MSAQTTAILSLVVYFVVQIGLVAFWIVMIRCGVILINANERIPVNLLKVKYIEPPTGRPVSRTFQRILAGAFILSGFVGILSSLSAMLGKITS
jgi:hypothetical protein